MLKHSVLSAEISTVICEKCNVSITHLFLFPLQRVCQLPRMQHLHLTNSREPRSKNFLGKFCNENRIDNISLNMSSLQVTPCNMFMWEILCFIFTQVKPFLKKNLLTSLLILLCNSQSVRWVSLPMSIEEEEFYSFFCRKIKSVCHLLTRCCRNRKI